MRSMSMSIKGKENFDRIIKLPAPWDPVTRRIHKRPYKKGERFHAIHKAMGLKKGEAQVRWAECVIVSATVEPLDYIIKYPYRGGSPYSECEREGFKDMDPEDFVTMVIKAHSGKHLKPDSPVSRYEFREVQIGVQKWLEKLK